MTSDSHFFTNERDTTVLGRLKKILSNNTEYFNVIVGYFYSTGFYKLYDALENVRKIQILIGLGTDKNTFNALFPTNSTTLETRNQFVERVKKELAESEEKKEIEQGIIKFIEYIESGKLEIRAYPGKALHAKVYIMLKKEGSEDLGKVITGSSNFTVSGLDENIEFNIELKDAPDVRYAQKKFEELWAQSIPVSEEYVHTVTEQTHLNNKFTPYEIYLKTLYEYFKDILNYDLKGIEVPDEFKQLRYQIEAVLQAKSKLEAHNGVFISDVVGLGKTYIASMLAKEMNVSPLIICPPRLKTYWEETMHAFGVIPKVWSSGSLEKLVDQENLNKYPVVFIDEAHKFRNSDTKTYGILHEICAGKKVVLISATPLNNKPSDVASQIYLFENRYNSTIPNLPNLATFFTHLQRKYDEIKKKYKEGQNTISLSDIKYISDEMRNKVLKHIMIRRTRADVKRYYGEDLKKQHLTFPEIADPRLIYYQLDERLNTLFDKSVKIIESPRDKKTTDKLFYARYMPLSYLKEDGKKYLLKSKQVENIGDIKFLKTSEALLVGLMRTFFLKRLDSSFFAFKKSLDNIVTMYGKMIDMYDKGTVYISKKVDVYDYIQRGEETELEKVLEEKGGVAIPSKYFDKRFKTNLEKDALKLSQLKEEWDSVSEDPKLDEIANLLSNDQILGKEKVIIFTEFEDTERYLMKKIPILNPSLKNKIIGISSRSKANDINKVLKNFDPNYPEGKQEDDYRVLIATEVLSEGLNLNKARAVVNYDIPWNPTRVIQRFGRINRIGTEGKIYIYNFFPTVKTDSKIHLREAARSKMEMFINALGADAKYLTGEDTVNKRGLFDRINTKETYQENEEVNEELEYLLDIRKIRDNNPALFKKIKSMPVKARTTRTSNSNKVLTYFKIGNLSKFFISDEKETQELVPVDAMKKLKADKNEKGFSLPEFYWDLFHKNELKFKEELNKNQLMSINNPTKGRSEAHLIKFIKAWLNIPNVNQNTSLKNYLLSLLSALQMGAISGYAIKQALKTINTKDLAEKQVIAVSNVIKQDYIDNSIKNVKRNRKKQIILSEIYTDENK